MRGGDIPDLSAVVEETGPLGLRGGSEGGPDPGQGVLRVVGHLDHAAVGVSVSETGVQTAQADHVIEAQTGAGECVGKDFRQSQNARSGLDHDAVHLDASDLATRTLRGFDHSHRQPTDAGPDHQHLRAGFSPHVAPNGADNRAVAHRVRPGRRPCRAAPARRIPETVPADGCGPGDHR